jgi:pimeloyl-ACP methyl ester carboxylesterase
MHKTLHHPEFEGGSYIDTGEGFPVVLIHGFPEDATIFSSQEEYLKDHYRLIIPDLPGSGSSPRIKDISIEEMAAYVHVILENEQISNCIVIGHSMGGYITLAFAEKYPELLKGYGFFHSTAFADSEEKKQGRMRSIEFMKSHGAQTFVQQMVPGLFSPAFKKDHLDIVRKIIKNSEKIRTEVLIDYYNAMLKRPERTYILRQSKVPVLFIFGKDDTIIPLESSINQACLPPVSSVQIFDKTGHMGMIENKWANEVLKDFITFCTSYHS